MLASVSSFAIHNSSESSMTLIHEPECFEYELLPGEEAIIEFDSGKESIYLRWYGTEAGSTAVAILGENSLYSVYSKGVNVFEKYLG
ncbi:hypothetical protein QMK33_09050 [Hymenobacter sp. H14-R3]|uniref:hypothetical protein n=1 Tax=Hymenobacter sp. H14-R3 TaxID=3046308 RepID=UPI0024BB9A86|nr:hypothetical protein [Hymenobacter sp. H14-R3]MDJ0365300.1 hypothetical protein [Hymenobacter sp. H14-R3]